MKKIKTISIFKSNENIPFMTCIVNDIEESKKQNKAYSGKWRKHQY